MFFVCVNRVRNLVPKIDRCTQSNRAHCSHITYNFIYLKQRITLVRVNKPRCAHWHFYWCIFLSCFIYQNMAFGSAFPSAVEVHIFSCCVCVWCCRLTFEIIFHFLSSGWFASTGTLQLQRCMVDSAIVFPCILIWTVTFNNNVDRNVLKRQHVYVKCVHIVRWVSCICWTNWVCIHTRYTRIT